MDDRTCSVWLRHAVMASWMCLLAGPSDAAAASRWGVALGSSVNGEVPAVRLVPTATWTHGRGQLEAGVGFHPYVRSHQAVQSGELNAKFFPNGSEEKLNLYLVSRLAYVHRSLESYYPTDYHYLFLLGGYGFTVTNPSGVYLGTNVTVGPYTFRRRSDNPYPTFSSDGLFDERGLALAFQADLGIRF